ncbi:DUF2865 domain-containing protein [Phyllobacterium sp. SYP-B3895]|uniref:DUF2865 domain-containing protein n=1 Tax=Phyllobacterium sp. SYP-B3895 TaxID=2663240 RepID=UPI0015620EAF|nr:DUF2865 domain-containing protein [Phyllobacterium sp. SYP-B3895]
MHRTLQSAIIAAAAILATAPLAYANSDNCVRMQERLDQLNSNADVDDYELQLRRDRVVAALDANDCPIIDSPIHDEPRYDMPLRDQPIPDYPVHEAPQRDYPLRDTPRRATAAPSYEIYGTEPEPVEPEMSTAPVSGGRYQTLCVRSCDGYYFPISYDTGAENFARDQAQCQSQCTGAKLFYRPTENQDPAAMISLRGDAYRNTPNAFKFRKVGANGTPQCSCQKTAGDFKALVDPRKVAAPTPKPALAEPAKPAAPRVETATPAEAAKPSAQPQEAKSEPTVPAGEPATQASSIIQLGEPEAKKTEVEKPKPLTEDKPIDPNRKVRVVGPTFLPDQEGAADPQAPDQKRAQ